MIIRKGQSLSEYSLILAIVFIAVVGVHIYVKRGVQGRYRDEVDSLWGKVVKLTQENTNLSAEKKAELIRQPQYEPYYASSDSTIDAPREIIATGSSKGNLLKVMSSGLGQTTADTTTTEGINVEGWQEITE